MSAEKEAEQTQITEDSGKFHTNRQTQNDGWTDREVDR